ncbi:helix-turn-helix domain-containing protein [Peteryoungia desertarenae]|uniref:Helix-turn-helix domain-containing protein n=1 Tax=Peteryoungia desertarenae TaxID=1813451 RepID=A0ABX6QNL5_9HYPH|nr:helix-turn-helix domain-containing protein [Peteryoungia desertarenae]QLF70174.1 helix-turn-helix domain-containing protein [Peteryoungia desertarenae]
MNNMRVREAAEYLGLSKSTLDRLRCYGGGPRYFKLGKAVTYDPADLKAWRDERARADVWTAANDNVARQVAV